MKTSLNRIYILSDFVSQGSRAQGISLSISLLPNTYARLLVSNWNPSWILSEQAET